MLELFGFPGSPYCRAVHLILEALETPYQYKMVNITKGEQMNPDYLKINPQHTVPAIKDGDFCLSESNAILTYIANAYGQGFIHVHWWGIGGMTPIRI